MKICLAPMDWVTDCAYRIICKQIFQTHWNVDDELMLWTEFMSADWYTHNPSWVIKHLLKSDFDHETIAQIFWWNTDSLIACAVDIQKKYSYSWIELNMWCPSPKIMKCAAWSGMLKDKQKTLSILKSISSQIDLPFSLKTRIWLTQDDIQEQFDFLLEASKYVHLISVHGRTYKQSHSWDVDRNFIYKLKEQLPDTLIIWNWWLSSYQDCVTKINNLDWMMPAQRAIGNPWILTPYVPTNQDVIETIFKHLDLSVACELHFKQAIQNYDHSHGLEQPTYENLQHLAKDISNNTINVDHCHAPIEFRKYLFRYINGFPNNKACKKNIPQARNYKDLKKTLSNYFDSIS